MIIKLVLCFVVLILIPLFLGIQFMRNDEKEKNNLLFAYLIGYLIEFTIFQLMTVPMIFKHCKFTTLLYLWTGLIVLLTVVSLILNIKRMKDIFKTCVENVKTIPLISIGTIILIGIQIYMPFKYMYLNNDDARFVAMSTTAIQTNTLMEYDALDGGKYTASLPLRRVLAPFPLYIAVISKLVNLPPAIFAHTVFPVIFILIGYMVYILICKKVLKLNPKETALFLIFISVINIFGDYSEYTQFTFLLKRIWQGKAIIAGIFIPLTCLLFYCAIKNDTKKDWFALLLLIFSSSMVSTIGNILVPMSLSLLACLFSIKDKKISYFIKSIVCCIPCIVYTMIYFLF